MTTQQHDTVAMTDHELEQVNGGAFPLPQIIIGGAILIILGAGVVWGAGKVLDGLDEVQDAADGSKKRSCK